jgi:hypothetical protein
MPAAGPTKLKLVGGGVLSGVAALGLYGLTLAPTVQGFDSAELTIGAYTLGFVHAPGYPLYMLLGHLFSYLPVGDVGFRLNLLSAICGSLAVGVLFMLLLAQTRHWPAAALAAGLFATAPVFWSQTARAEVYTLHVLLVVSVLALWFWAQATKQAGLYCACFGLLGVGMAHHLTMALLWGAVVIIAFWLKHPWRWLSVAASAAGAGIMAAGYLYFPWRSGAALSIDYLRPYFGVDLRGPAGLAWLMTGQAFHCAAFVDQNLATWLTSLGRFCTLLWNNWLGIGAILGVWGWLQLRRTHALWNRLLSIYFLFNALAYFYYHVIDKEVMFSPLFAAGSIWIANGISAMAAWIESRAARPLVARRLIYLALGMVIAGGVALNWPWVSLRHDRRVYEFASQITDELPPGAVVVNHWATASVFDYIRLVEKQRPDIASFNLDFYFLSVQKQCGEAGETDMEQAWFEWLRAQRQKPQPLCFVEPLPPLPGNLGWAQQGPCWILVERQASE